MLPSFSAQAQPQVPCAGQFERYQKAKGTADTLPTYIDYLACLYLADPVRALTEIEVFLAQPDVIDSEHYLRVRNLRAANLNNLSRYDEALAAYQALHELAESRVDTKYMTVAYMNQGIIYRRKSQYGNALEAYLLAVNLARTSNRQTLLAAVVQNLGTLYNSMERYEIALVTLREAYQLYEIMDSERGKALAAANLGITFKLMGELDSAVHHYEYAASSFERDNDLYNFAKMQSNIGQLQLATGNYRMALTSLDKAIAMMEQQQNINDLVNSLNAKTNVLVGMKYLEQARTTAKRAAQAAENLGYLYGAHNAYENLTEIAVAQSDYKAAYTNYLQKQVFADSMYSEDQRELIAEMETRFELEKKDIELEAKDLKLELQTTQLRNSYLLGISLLVIVIGLSIYFWRIRRLNAKLEAQGLLLEKKNMELAQIGSFKDRLLTIVSHDVRNPLSGLKSILELQASGAINEAELSEWNVDVTKRIEGALGMLGNLLEWSKTQWVSLKPFKERMDGDFFMRELIEQVQYQASLKGVTLKWEITEGLVIHSDRHMLRTCLYNLISNAIKFSEKLGVVWVKGFNTDKGVVFEVSDEGIGMNAEALEKVRNPQVIFSTYGTENEKGTGIGLVLTYELLQLLDANIEIESEEGKGSTFRIHLNE